MRDPNRIDEFCATLATLWHKVPDWRFGQLMCNVLGEVYANTNVDPFFIEDDEMISEMHNFFNKEYKTK